MGQDASVIVKQSGQDQANVQVVSSYVTDSADRPFLKGGEFFRRPLFVLPHGIEKPLLRLDISAESIHLQGALSGKMTEMSQGPDALSNLLGKRLLNGGSETHTYHQGQGGLLDGGSETHTYGNQGLLGTLLGKRLANGKSKTPKYHTGEKRPFLKIGNGKGTASLIKNGKVVDKRALAGDVMGFLASNGKDVEKGVAWMSEQAKQQKAAPGTSVQLHDVLCLTH